MASSSDTQKSKGPLVNPAICRCCRSIKKCRLLGAEYEWMGTKEVYSDMIMDCFGLLLSYLDADDKESCICATCVTRLRDAVSFRRLVLGSEELFLQTKLGHSDDPEPKVEVELIKSEPPDFTEDGSNDDHLRDDDYLPDHYSDNEDTKEHIERKKPTLRSSKLRPKTEPKLKSTIKSVSTKSEGRKKAKVPSSKESTSLKKKLLTEMKKLKHKLSQQTEKIAAPTKKPKRPPPADRESLAHQNALAMIASSYVVPFQNRVSNYYCFYCKDQFTDPTELREHTWKHPPKELAYYMDSRKPPKVDITRVDCRLCTETVGDLETLKTHIASAHGEFIHKGITNECLTFRLTLNNLACTSCAATFPYFDQLKKHMVEHFGTFTCHECGACFLEETSLLTHIRTVHHRYNEGVLFPCEICGKSLKSKYSKDLHIATVHEKKPTVNCYKCEASFLSHALRNRHLIEAHADKRTFPCKLCDKVYNRRKTLMEHNRRNHLKVFRHQCELCEQKFYIPSRLREHMVTHTGERNFRCELCDKTYPRLKSLREHTRTHTNERKYKCDVCQTTFTQNASLRSHVKSHHQGFQLEAGFA